MITPRAIIMNTLKTNCFAAKPHQSRALHKSNHFMSRRYTHSVQKASIFPLNHHHGFLGIPRHASFFSSSSTTPFTLTSPSHPPQSTPSSKDQGWLIDSNISTDYDAIIVLGGGLLPDGGLPPWVERRLDGALHLYRNQEKPLLTPPRPCPILLLGAGTPHKPPVLNENGYVLHESTAYAAYLLQHNVPSLDVLKETSSYDTVGNGYFSVTMHAIPANWFRIAVVTSDFHMLRTRAIFETVYSLAATDLICRSRSPLGFELSFHSVSDDGLFDPEVLIARSEKEQKAVDTWHKNMKTVTSMVDLHRWLFATHLCYSVSRQHEFGVYDDIDPKLAATY